MKNHSKKGLFVICVIAVAIIIGVILFATDLVFNNCCAGITLADYDMNTDIIVRLFKSERQAYAFYKSIDVDAYYIVAVDSDSAPKTTDVWFENLKAPLVGEKAKYVSLNGSKDDLIFQSFIDSNKLLIYQKGPGLDDAAIDKNELDQSLSIRSLGSYKYSWLDESYSEEERSYAYSNMLLCDNIKLGVKNLELSRNANDTYSTNYWEVTLKELSENFDCGNAPTLIRDNLDWTEEADYYRSIREKISNSISDESQMDNLKTYKVGYEARITSLFVKMNQTAGTIIEGASPNEKENELSVEEDKNQIQENSENSNNAISWWKNDNKYVADNGDSFEILWYDDDYMRFAFDDEQYGLHGNKYEVSAVDGCLLYALDDYPAIEVKFNKSDESISIQGGNHKGTYYPQKK